jgi:L-2,4-diaminobutyrate decarboxylase
MSGHGSADDLLREAAAGGRPGAGERGGGSADDLLREAAMGGPPQSGRVPGRTDRGAPHTGVRSPLDAPVVEDDALAIDDAALAANVATTLSALTRGREDRGGPTPAGPPEDPRRALDALLDGSADPDGALPATGVGASRALDELVTALAAGHTDPGDPRCAAHLHCPPLAVAVAADLAVSVLNPSLDSWDQGPSSAAAEDRVIAALAGLVGFDPSRAGGTMTTGATASTLTGLLLAREAADGPVRIACSALAHFSVLRAAQVLGLDADAVHPVPVDAESRMDPAALDAVLAGVVSPVDRGAVPGAATGVPRAEDGTTPTPDGGWIVVATAGTTDLGAIDPLPAVADVAAAHGAWLHVDAAYGGGALFSRALAPLLDGIARADSVAMDLHKLGWQPVAAGVLLLRERERSAPMDLQVAYLNAEDDDEAGYEDRLGRSLRTTRRPDAFKVLATMRALGREGLGDLVDRCHALAHDAAAAVTADPRLELHGPPTLTTILLRPSDEDPARRDARCAAIRRALLRDGLAVVGRTEIPGDGPGRRWLKLTLLNPAATTADVTALVALVGDAAAG